MINKVLDLPRSILLTILVLMLVLAYTLAIRPTLQLYHQVGTLEKEQEANLSGYSPAVHLQEKIRLDSLLNSLQIQDLQTEVLGAVAKEKLKLQSFKQEQLANKDQPQRYSLLVSGDYAHLLALLKDLSPLAIASSICYTDEQQREYLKVDLWVNPDKS